MFSFLTPVGLKALPADLVGCARFAEHIRVPTAGEPVDPFSTGDLDAQ